MGIMLVNYGLLPAALPLVVRPVLAVTKTHLDRQGVCRQSHAYTCGPAAAVTCLARLGVTAEEGQLAIDARTGPAVGTYGRCWRRRCDGPYPEVACRYCFVEES